MKVKALSNFRYSLNGYVVSELTEGEEKDLPEDLAQQGIESGKLELAKTDVIVEPIEIIEEPKKNVKRKAKK